MTKEELLEEIASAVGDIDIAISRMTPQAALDDIRKTCEHLREIVHSESETVLFMSGDPLFDVGSR